MSKNLQKDNSKLSDYEPDGLHHNKPHKCKYPKCPYPCPDLPDCRDAEQPASKPWIGLTDKEIKRMAALWFLSMYWPLCNTFARAIEAKLKEKNA